MSPQRAKSGLMCYLATMPVALRQVIPSTRGRLRQGARFARLNRSHIRSIVYADDCVEVEGNWRCYFFISRKTPHEASTSSGT
jgi:hypothetical protein